MTTQQHIIHALGVKPVIDVAQEIVQRVEFLKQYILASRTTGLLIGISGGVDSAVATALCKRATDELATEKKQDYQTVGLLQPYGQQEDIAHSRAVVTTFGITQTVEMNITEAVDEATIEAEYALKKLGFPRHLSQEGKGNVKARMRMVLQYALANELNLLVVGTDHASEALIGYFTKYGDGAVDIAPLSTLTKRQIYALATALGVPEDIRQKAPTAGLWPGQTDESQIGISYAHNSDYLEGKYVDPTIAQKLERLFAHSAHKRDRIPSR